MLLDPHLSIQELARFTLPRFAGWISPSSTAGGWIPSPVAALQRPCRESARWTLKRTRRGRILSEPTASARVSDAALCAVPLRLVPCRADRLLTSGLSDRHGRVRGTTARDPRHRTDLASPDLLWEVFMLR